MRWHSNSIWQFASLAARSDPLNQMINFDQVFSTESIIRELCKARVSLAAIRHDALFFHSISKNRPSAEEVPLPQSWGCVPVNIFPRRRLWNRYRPLDRRNPSLDVNLETLYNAVLDLRARTPSADWVLLLNETVTRIQNRALASNRFTFEPPKIVAAEKDRAKEEYRPLAAFSLSDKVVDCLTARYFREILDGAFSNSCLAFRPRRDGRHDGLEEVLKRNLANSQTGLFAAECDIRVFYDCVPHEIARSGLKNLVADALASNPSLLIDERATEIFEAYLDSYSFQENIRKVA